MTIPPYNMELPSSEGPGGFGTGIPVMSEPVGMGRHFLKVFADDKWLHWRMAPFILIWAVFIVLLVVRIRILKIHHPESIS